MNVKLADYEELVDKEEIEAKRWRTCDRLMDNVLSFVSRNVKEVHLPTAEALMLLIHGYRDEMGRTLNEVRLKKAYLSGLIQNETERTNRRSEA